MLKIEGLKVRYGKVRAVNGVDMEIEQGEIATLIGANGAGKTTLLRAISGLNKPNAGNISLEGEDITNMAPEDINLRGLAHVPEGRRLFGQMTILENLELGAFQRNNKLEMDNNIERIYEHFPDLKHRTKQMAGSLSGGQQQMVAIGRAMMSSPKVILMDEPSLGLSPVMCQEIARIIRQINEAGVTILLVEQNARLALSLARHGFVMETGRIVMKGIADEMQSDPKVQAAYLGIG